MGREAKTHNKLTPKQDSFVKGILSGKTPTQSAMIAYNASTSKSASVIASQNLNKLSIREALEEALRTQGLTLDVITGNIGNLANHKPEKVSGDTVLKANVELLKLHGAYPDKKSYQFNMSVKGRIKDMTYQQAQEELARVKKRLADFEEDIQA